MEWYAALGDWLKGSIQHGVLRTSCTAGQSRTNLIQTPGPCKRAWSKRRIHRAPWYFFGNLSIVLRHAVGCFYFFWSRLRHRYSSWPIRLIIMNWNSYELKVKNRLHKVIIRRYVFGGMFLLDHPLSDHIIRSNVFIFSYVWSQIKHCKW